MSEKYAIILIAVVGITVGVIMIVKYWFRSVKELSAGDISNLSLWNKIVFSLEQFCGGVNHKRDFKAMRLEDEMGKVPTEDFNKSRTATATDTKAKGRTNDFVKKEKFYNMRENM